MRLGKFMLIMLCICYFLLFFLIFLLLFGQRSSVMHTLSFQREDVKKKSENLKQNLEPLWQYMYYTFQIYSIQCAVIQKLRLSNKKLRWRGVQMICSNYHFVVKGLSFLFSYTIINFNGLIEMQTVSSIYTIYFA